MTLCVETPTMNRALLIAGATTILTSGAAQDAAASQKIGFLICQPGGPKLRKAQQKVMGKMYRYLEKKVGLPEGQIEGSYTNDRKECLAKLKERPAVVFPSLPIFLEHRRSLGLKPVAQLKVNGKVKDHFYVMAKKGSGIDKPEALSGKTLTGTHLGSSTFAVDIVLEGRAKKLQLKPQRRGLRSIKAVLKGKADAVLLDGTQYHALQGTKLAEDLQVVHTSQALPTPPVTVIEKKAPKGFARKLGRALVAMTTDAEGQEVVRLFKIEGFQVPMPRAWASLEARFKSAP